MDQELARGGTMMSPISFYGKGIEAVESSYLIACAVSRMLGCGFHKDVIT